MSDFQDDRYRGLSVLVTGGAGFIGSNLVAALLRSGAWVTVLDDLYTGRKENLPVEDKRLIFVEGSVCNRDKLEELFQTNSYAVVFHQAARNIIVSTKNPREDFEVNIGGTLNILMAARDENANRIHDEKLLRVVYASSASVYGNPRYLPINEDDATSMLSPYAVSKFGGENYCRAFYESYGLSTTAVRYSNVFGPGQRVDNPYCGVVAKFFASAIAGEPLRIHGDGEQTRDFTFIDDVVEATMLAGISPKAEGQVYNVGTGRETSVRQLAQAVIDITGSASALEFIDRRDIDNIRRRVVNIEKIRRELRWSPRTTVATGLVKTEKWIWANTDGAGVGHQK